MDSRLTVGVKIDLEQIETRLSVDPDERPTVYVSQLLDESPNGQIIAAMPFQEGKLVPLSVGQKFNASFYSKSGLYCCKVEVTGRFKKGSVFLMELTQISILEKVQRRQYFRLDYNASMEYRVVDEEEQTLLESGTLVEEDALEIEWKKSIIMDISGGGIRFVAPTKEEKGSIIQVKFEMPVGTETEIFCLYAVVLRVEKKEKNSIFEHRIMFWQLNQTLREKLIRSIFEVQRKKRSNSSTR